MSNKLVAIIDYGVGNLGSVFNMLYKMGHHSIVTSSISEIRKADKIILPGIGSFDSAIKKLKNSGLYDEIFHNVHYLNKPILGICLGMQLLGSSSLEGNLNGFGFIKFDCLDFNGIKSQYNLKVPNMGWRNVNVTKKNNFTNEINTDSRFYFVHSYYVPYNIEYTVLSSNYGVQFTAALNFKNIYGTQFHPEKSHKYGMVIFNNFINL